MTVPHPILVYVGGFDLLIAALWFLRPRPSPRRIVGGAIIVALVNASAWVCTPAMVGQIAGFGGVGLIALLFAAPAAPPSRSDHGMSERKNRRVFFRALIPGVLLVGPLFVLASAIGQSHPALATPWWASLAECIVIGCLYAFALYDHHRRQRQ